MKPTLQDQPTFNRDGLTSRCSGPRRMVAPPIDFNFHAHSVEQFKGNCGPACFASFRDISSDYFEHEAPRATLRETVVFAVMIGTVAMPLIHSASAMLELIRTFAL